MKHEKLIKATPLHKRTPEEAAAAEVEAQRRQEEWQRKVDEDARLAVPKAIEKLRKEAAEKLAKANEIEALLKEYPDLREKVGRWNKVAYCSKAVNPKVNRFDIRHNCGCCNDSPLEIWPYLESPLGNIYSDPPKFVVGERHWMGGDKPYGGWKREMQEAGIPEGIIGAVSMHFKKDRDDRIASASEDGEDYSEESDDT